MRRPVTQGGEATEALGSVQERLDQEFQRPFLRVLVRKGFRERLDAFLLSCSLHVFTGGARIFAAALLRSGLAVATLQRQKMIVAIDVGTRNMSLCALRRTAQGEACTLPPLITTAKRRLRSMELVRWEVTSLHLARNASLPLRAAAVASFVADRRAIFLEAAVVVVESQMQSAMRTIAACLFSCVRLIAGNNVVMISQAAKTKLCWTDLAQICSRSDTYSTRKSAAVKCAYFLLGLRAQGRKVQIDEAVPSNIEAMRAVLMAPGKKDDLADSLLHLCAYDCLQMPTRGIKRTQSCAELVLEREVEQMQSAEQSALQPSKTAVACPPP